MEENTEQEAERKKRQTGQRHSMKHLRSLQVCPCLFSRQHSVCQWRQPGLQAVVNDSNHYCQTHHYNKQSPLTSGEETDILSVMLFTEHVLIYPAELANEGKLNTPHRNTHTHTRGRTPGCCQLVNRKQNTTNELLSSLVFHLSSPGIERLPSFREILWRAVHISGHKTIHRKLRSTKTLLSHFTVKCKPTYCSGAVLY